MVHVTAFFAALLTFVYIGLAFYIIRKRYALRVSIGDGSDEDMSRRIRAHANFSEYVPLGLVLMALAELNGKPHGLLLTMGCLLTAGRLSHAYSLLIGERKPMNFKFRMAGMIATFTTLIVLAISLLT